MHVYCLMYTDALRNALQLHVGYLFCAGRGGDQALYPGASHSSSDVPSTHHLESRITLYCGFALITFVD